VPDVDETAHQVRRQALVDDLIMFVASDWYRSARGSCA
jgi:hypothetical protein